jgi:hypothetical protein
MRCVCHCTDSATPVREARREPPSRRRAFKSFTLLALAGFSWKRAMSQPPSPAETLLCIPGAWADRTDFIRRVITLEPKGRYMFAGAILADLHEKDHVALELHPQDPDIPRAFGLAGQGRLEGGVLRSLEAHQSVAYLRFAPNLMRERDRVLRFCQVLQAAGGLAVKVESAGVAHSWERWRTLLSGSTFDQYTAVVTLVADADWFYSCGMHNLALADCEVPVSLGTQAGAELMNVFNHWRVAESPVLEDGHTFSLAADAPRYRVRVVPDSRHEPGDPFFNPHGLWRLLAA